MRVTERNSNDNKLLVQMLHETNTKWLVKFLVTFYVMLLFEMSIYIDKILYSTYVVSNNLLCHVCYLITNKCYYLWLGGGSFGC